MTPHKLAKAKARRKDYEKKLRAWRADKRNKFTHVQDSGLLPKSRKYKKAEVKK